MRLEDLAVVLRRRTPWEALDLGREMLLAWRGPLFAAWCAVYLPTLLVACALFWPQPIWGALVAWWLKPAFDRVLLFVLARASFGAAPSLSEVRRALPGLWFNWPHLWALTLARLGMARSFLLPVVQLEGLRGGTARKRRAVLGRRTRGHAVWLTVLCSNLSGVLYLSALAAVTILTPDDGEGRINWNLLALGTESETWQQCLSIAAIVVAETIVEPLYVASGFALYLNRRSDLEAWDVELGLRRLAARVAGATLCGLLLIACLVPQPAAAAAGSEAAKQSDPARAAIDAVLAEAAFGHEEKSTHWRRIPPDKKKSEPFSFPEWLSKLGSALASLATDLTRVLWVAAVALLAVLIWRARHKWLPQPAARPPPPQYLWGLDVRPESLPPDVAAAALAELAGGRLRAALSLLYRGALVAAMHEAGVRFTPGSTEGDALREARGHFDVAAAQWFAQLVAVWTAAAYAHRLPAQEAVAELCRGWPTRFAREAA
ncbi:MAG: DUF4129 domain-containing protein [Rhodocyclaceae bacterium]|nr:DUF4129 domain-containing protein [Rhodocyclaceae bacterium]MBX3669945.1 DUF4129 domain-containing protein [Rhodocyclaceae bacterium]